MDDNIVPELYLILHERIINKYKAGTVITADQLRRFIAMVGRVPHSRINKVLIELCDYGLIDMNSPIKYALNKMVEI